MRRRPVLGPLWTKAMMMQKSHNLDITILLGNFHTQMSFLGSIGYVMKNSGLKELLSTIYAENSVKKILEGKQYESAMRIHNLLVTVLKKTIVRQIDSMNPDELISYYDQLLDSGLRENDISSITNVEACNTFLSEYTKVCEKLSVSKLNQFWLLYIEMVDILHMNLMAEQTGNTP